MLYGPKNVWESREHMLQKIDRCPEHPTTRRSGANTRESSEDFFKDFFDFYEKASNFDLGIRKALNHLVVVLRGYQVLLSLSLSLSQVTSAP